MEGLLMKGVCFQPLTRTRTRVRANLGMRRSAVVASASASSPRLYHNSEPSKGVLETWRKADAVCFDVDSTVCVDEGIDELARFCGAGEAVAEWTARAMSGSVPFEDALAARLALIKPSLSQLREFLRENPPRLGPGVCDLVRELHSRSVDVFLVSGGFRQMIDPVAALLHIPERNVFANRLLFDPSSGDFAGFDTAEPTSRTAGKAKAVQQIKRAHSYDTLVMIGDGATDLEARQPNAADLFICYAGVQLRHSVAHNADWLVFDFQHLITAFH